MNKVLIIGALSAIARETAKLFAANGDELFLVARSEERLKQVCDDLKVRGALKAKYLVADLNEFDRHESILKEAGDKLGGIDIVLIAHGTLGDQEDCQKSYAKTEEQLKTNFLSIVSLLTPIANTFESKRHGTIGVISSVAGDRGRQSNYIYGTAKGAVNVYLQGLRNRLQAANVAVVTIKPGFVDTPMTRGIKKGPLFATSQKVAADIHNALLKKKDVIYTPCFWILIMLIIKSIPEAIFKRLKL